MITPLAPAAGDAPESTFDAVVRLIEEHLGAVPESFKVNGVDTPAEDALALLRWNAGAAPEADGVYLPDHDVGFGVRAGPNGCVVAAVVTAVSVSWSPREALVREEMEPRGSPGGRLPCGFGFRWITGEVGATVAPGVSFAVACVNQQESGPGAWLVENAACHGSDFVGANIVGHVGLVDIRGFGCIGWRCGYVTIEQLFGGVCNWTLVLGCRDIDPAVITLSNQDAILGPA